VDALWYSHAYHNLTDRLCLRIYDTRRGELAELCLFCFALHVVHPVQYLIVMQLVIFLPIALIRNLAKLSTTALVASVFILAGLIYIFGSEFGFIAQRGIAKVELFNPKDFPLLIGYVTLR
jgi:hypothetical protein